MSRGSSRRQSCEPAIIMLGQRDHSGHFLARSPEGMRGGTGGRGGTGWWESQHCSAILLGFLVPGPGRGPRLVGPALGTPGRLALATGSRRRERGPQSGTPIRRSGPPTAGRVGLPRFHLSPIAGTPADQRSARRSGVGLPQPALSDGGRGWESSAHDPGHSAAADRLRLGARDRTFPLVKQARVIRLRANLHRQEMQPRP